VKKISAFLTMVLVRLINAMFSRTSGLLSTLGLMIIFLLGVFKIDAPIAVYQFIGWGLVSFYVALCLLGIIGGRSARVNALISKLQMD
jgi:hypothetical protein